MFSILENYDFFFNLKLILRNREVTLNFMPENRPRPAEYRPMVETISRCGALIDLITILFDLLCNCCQAFYAWVVLQSPTGLVAIYFVCLSPECNESLNLTKIIEFDENTLLSSYSKDASIDPDLKYISSKQHAVFTPHFGILISHTISLIFYDIFHISWLWES